MCTDRGLGITLRNQVMTVCFSPQHFMIHKLSAIQSQFIWGNDRFHFDLRFTKMSLTKLDVIKYRIMNDMLICVYCCWTFCTPLTKSRGLCDLIFWILPIKAFPFQLDYPEQRACFSWCYRMSSPTKAAPASDAQARWLAAVPPVLPNHLCPFDGLLELHQPLLVLVPFHQDSGHLHPGETLPLGCRNVALSAQYQHSTTEPTFNAYTNRGHAYIYL